MRAISQPNLPFSSDLRNQKEVLRSDLSCHQCLLPPSKQNKMLCWSNKCLHERHCTVYTLSPFIRNILKRRASEIFLIWDNFARPVSAILRNFQDFLSPAIFSYWSVLDVTDFDPEMFSYFTRHPTANKKKLSPLLAKQNCKSISVLRTKQSFVKHWASTLSWTISFKRHSVIW